MATLIQSVGLFGDIFDFFLPFILVFAITYGILMKTKFLSERADVNAMVALALGLVVVFSGAGKFITTITPFFAAMFIVIFLLFLMFLFFGVEKDIKSIIFNNRMIVALIVIISLIFIFYSVGVLYGNTFYGGTGTSTGGTSAGVSATINQTTPIGPEVCDYTRIAGSQAVTCMLGDPRVLGTLVLLGLMAIATFFIIYVPKK